MGTRAEETGFIGLDDLKKRLEEVYGKLSGAVMRDALYAAAGVYRDAIEAATPVGKTEYTYKYGSHTVRIKHRPGTAKQNVIIYQRKRRGQLSVGESETSLLVGHNKKFGYYAYFIEYGNRNQPARGFARAAYDSATPAALEAAKSVLSAGLKGM